MTLRIRSFRTGLGWGMKINVGNEFRGVETPGYHVNAPPGADVAALWGPARPTPNPTVISSRARNPCAKRPLTTGAVIVGHKRLRRVSAS